MGMVMVTTGMVMMVMVLPWQCIMYNYFTIIPHTLNGAKATPEVQCVLGLETFSRTVDCCGSSWWSSIGR